LIAAKLVIPVKTVRQENLKPEGALLVIAVLFSVAGQLPRGSITALVIPLSFYVAVIA